MTYRWPKLLEYRLVLPGADIAAPPCVDICSTLSTDRKLLLSPLSLSLSILSRSKDEGKGGDGRRLDGVIGEAVVRPIPIPVVPVTPPVESGD